MAIHQVHTLAYYAKLGAWAYLQATIEELETSSEAFKAANEELQSANEELQSANEELITINAEHFQKYEMRLMPYRTIDQPISPLLKNRSTNHKPVEMCGDIVT